VASGTGIDAGERYTCVETANEEKTTPVWIIVRPTPDAEPEVYPEDLEPGPATRERAKSWKPALKEGGTITLSYKDPTLGKTEVSGAFMRWRLENGDLVEEPKVTRTAKLGERCRVFKEGEGPTPLVRRSPR
jgi:hypothetical protein